jgi:hypothetical protein
VEVYRTIARQVGTPDALELAERLALWHDAMVAHQRAVGVAGEASECDDFCPHAEALELWKEAEAALGEAAAQLSFLKSIVEQVSGVAPRA